MIGRKLEIEILSKVLSSEAPQFLALTGRRRIGKTYLVRNFFNKQISLMEVVGKKNSSKADSLEIFIDALNSSFKLVVKIPPVNSWRLAFQAFTDALKDFNKPFVLFLDELPWLVSRDSELLSELDHFWNSQWTQIPNFKLIVCGSATSWIIDHIINNKGGLHNRLTAMIHLQPFTLREVEEYLYSRQIKLDREQIISLYLCIGGVPYYLDWVQENKSVPQIIQELCFSENGRLSTEYESLIDSLFIKSKKYKTILQVLSSKRYGLTAKELSEATKISLGGSLNKLLNELEACHFIRKYYPFGAKHRNSYYRLIDEFVMFHYKWIEPVRKKGFKMEDDYWLKRFNSPEFLIWAGYNFETLCHKHVTPILSALGISGIRTETTHWNHKVDASLGLSKNRYQIDLVIDRVDKVINLCEVKYSTNPLLVNKEMIIEIQARESVFKLITKTKKQLVSVLISATEVIGKNQASAIGAVINGTQLFE